MFQIIQNMYKNIKSNIVYYNDKSKFFLCDNDVRQGVNMYPFLFALFWNDLENFMENPKSTGLNTITEDIGTALNRCIHNISFLLYSMLTTLF
jgi:hypothetical protein